MPNTYTQLLFHVVFSTKNRERTLTDGKRDALYKYIWGIHSNLNCHLYRIGGVDDHVHILTGLPTTLAVAKYVQEIKAGSSHWLKSQSDFPRFESWQDGPSSSRAHPGVPLRSTPGYSKVAATRLWRMVAPS